MLYKKAKIDFLDRLVFIKNKSLLTQEQYNRHLEKFDDFISREKLKNIEVKDFDINLFNRFRIFIQKNASKNISQKTINKYMITLRSFLKYLEKQDIISLPPNKIELMKEEGRKISFLTDEELKSFFESINTSSLSWLRDLAIVKTIYSTWLRISELTNLNKNDINLKTKEFAIRWKWKKIRIIFLSDEACFHIENYLQKREDHFWVLFIRHNFKKENIKDFDEKNVRLTRQFITTMISKNAIKAWILKNVSAHTLRHSFATKLLSWWADLRSIQEMLWHSSITTTQVYTHTSNNKLKQLHDNIMNKWN